MAQNLNICIILVKSVKFTLIDYILDFIEYDYQINKFFYPLLAEKNDDEAKEIEKEIKKYKEQKKEINKSL